MAFVGSNTCCFVDRFDKAWRCVGLVLCALMCSESAGCPAAQHYQWFGVSAGVLQERQGQPCIGFGGVSSVSLDTPRCVSCTRRKTQTRVVAICGVQRMESEVCSWSLRSFFIFLKSPLLTGLSRSVGGAFLRNCTYGETLGALGPCTAPRTSHSPSSLRASHPGLHETVRCFSNCTWADVMHCVSFRLRVASAQSFMNDDIILALCAFRFYVVSSASDCVIVLSRILPSV